MRFGDNLKAARKAAGLTQQQVADALPIHRTTYTKYETQSVEPPFPVLRKLADLLGVTVDALLKDITEAPQTAIKQSRHQ